MMALGAAGIRATGSPGRAAQYVSNRDVYLSVTLAWTLAALLGGAPFLIEGTFSSLVDSTFEAMSGFTTTGATLLSDIEGETPSILFWRSMTHWLGGHRHRGSLRGGGAAARCRRRTAAGSRGLRTHSTSPNTAHRRHRQGAHRDLPRHLRGRDRRTPRGGHA